MESFPTELLIITFEFLNPFTLCQLAKVSKEFRECTANDKIWRKIRGITKRDMKILAENYEKAHLRAIENWNLTFGEARSYNYRGDKKYEAMASDTGDHSSNPVKWVYSERIKDAYQTYSEWLNTLKM